MSRTKRVPSGLEGMAASADRGAAKEISALLRPKSGFPQMPSCTVWMRSTKALSANIESRVLMEFVIFPMGRDT